MVSERILASFQMKRHAVPCIFCPVEARATGANNAQEGLEGIAQSCDCDCCSTQISAADGEPSLEEKTRDGACRDTGLRMHGRTQVTPVRQCPLARRCQENPKEVKRRIRHLTTRWALEAGKVTRVSSQGGREFNAVIRAVGH